MAELKPCPFCGSEAEIVPINSNQWIACCTNEDCPIYYGLAFHTREKAKEWWNTRTPKERGGEK